MLKVNDLCVRYGARRVLDSVSFELGADEILMLVGPTGCGKTTVLNAIAGLVPLERGAISLGAWRASAADSIPPEQRKLGMVFQDFALFPHLNVLENITFRLRDLSVAERWIERLGLAECRQARPGALSGGQKQRVALARTLAHEPRLVLLDEPLSNLDAALKDELRGDIRDALKAAAVPALWVTHDQEEALSLGDRVGVLRRGALEQLDTPEVCFTAPANPFVARFLGEACFLSAVVGRGGAQAKTALGEVPVTPAATPGERLTVLVRPDDLAFAASGSANARLTSARYEGQTWLYGATLDAGGEVQLRVNHEDRRAVGTRVALTPCTGAALPAFAGKPLE